MKVFTYSEARQKFSKMLDMARTEEVLIKRRSGETFRIVYERPSSSPLDIPGIKTQVTTQDILEAIRESRERS